MRSKYIFGLLAVGAATAIGMAGCGGDTDTGGEGGSGGRDPTGTTGTTGSPSSSTAGSTTASTGGTGGAGGSAACGSDKDGNCDFDTAEEITLDNTKIESDLDPVDVDEDYYRFDGTAGQALLIYTEAKIGNDPFDPLYPDLVITLYDDQKNVIAENDDPTPRLSNDSEIYTILPATGTYYLRVEECNTWAEQNGLPAGSCSAPGDITETYYGVAMLELDPAFTFFTLEDKAKDYTQAAPGVVEYAAGMNPGTYVISDNAGFFADVNDKDYFSFTIPKVDDLATPGMVEGIPIAADERLIGYFSLLPAGVAGNGSSAPFGTVSILDPATMPPTIVAQVNGGSSDDMSPPLQSEKQYLLEIDAPAMGGDFAANPFYFFRHYNGGSNPVEAELMPGGTPNNTTVLAEQLTLAMGTTSFFIEGDLTLAPADLDFFKMTVPAMTNTVSVACGALRSGSGLTGFKATLLKADGTTEIGKGTETPDKDLVLQNLTATAGEVVYLKLEATSQSVTVTSSFYRCGVHFRNM